MKTVRLTVNPSRPEISLLKKAVEVLLRGGVLVIPTDTVYGLAASAFSREAQRKIYRLKGRSFRKPLVVMPPDVASLSHIAQVPPAARKLMRQFWPGPLTIVLPATELGKMVMGGRADLGARIPAAKVVQTLLKLFGGPLVTTSANPSSKPSAKNAREAAKYFDSKVDCIIDTGPAEIGKESTVIDMLRFPYVIIREGSMDSKRLVPYL